VPRLDLDLPDSINDTTVPPAKPLARTGQGANSDGIPVVLDGRISLYDSLRSEAIR
jgi:hypothetical protein